jgi:ribonuclease VapC
MIVDTSALIAVIREEPDWTELWRILVASETVSMSAATHVESAIVIDRSPDPADSVRFDRLVAEVAIAIVPVTAEHARLARQAYRDFGKGSGHRAQLDFGDSFSYALAVATGEPLLYQGADFRHTGIRSALPD